MNYLQIEIQMNKNDFQGPDDSSTIRLSYDELSKIILTDFFESCNYVVETEIELLDLPRRFDLLIIKHRDSRKLSFFDYFSKYNIISYKSFGDETGLYRTFFDICPYFLV